MLFYNLKEIIISKKENSYKSPACDEKLKSIISIGRKPAGKYNFIKIFILFASFIACFAYAGYAQETKGKKKPKKLNVSEKGQVRYGLASFYANKFEGRKTATGETFSQSKFTCACNVAPFGTWVKVTNMSNGKSVVVKINDRLHPSMKRLVDLSKIAARRLDYLSKGVTRVKLEVIGKAGR